MHFKQIVSALLLFMLGIVCGGYLFSKTVPRSFLAFRSGHYRFYNKQEIAGLVTSAAILRAPFLISDVDLESDTCLAIRHPKPKARIHFVLFPKHDTKNITTLTPADSPYLLGCFALARELILREKLQAYRLYTNGPRFQEIAYLHFHLIAE
ncbi:MAG: HIT domain-containing protein [Methylococcales bacterium]|nr:HIT domain-containing protein [Methylococcales bacterium]MDD5630688.1 HIT domain-containing protein [Methylococcales bacterium]